MYSDGKCVEDKLSSLVCLFAIVLLTSDYALL